MVDQCYGSALNSGVYGAVIAHYMTPLVHTLLSDGCYEKIQPPKVPPKG